MAKRVVKISKDLYDKLKADSEERERLEVVLGGITATAFGWGIEPVKECLERNGWASHPALRDVLNLRIKYDALLNRK